jgi:hypothetical protein
MDENDRADSDKDESIKVDGLKERLSLFKVLVSFAHVTNACSNYSRFGCSESYALIQ